jgi:hypothetical protein
MKLSGNPILRHCELLNLVSFISIDYNESNIRHLFLFIEIKIYRLSPFGNSEAKKEKRRGHCNFSMLCSILNGIFQLWHPGESQFQLRECEVFYE